jgi:hypothetical protein
MGRAFPEEHVKITVGETVLLPDNFGDANTNRASRRARKPGRQEAARG